jgi:hypothetical protein
VPGCCHHHEHPYSKASISMQWDAFRKCASCLCVACNCVPSLHVQLMFLCGLLQWVMVHRGVQSCPN